MDGDGLESWVKSQNERPSLHPRGPEDFRRNSSPEKGNILEWKVTGLVACPFWVFLNITFIIE